MSLKSMLKNTLKQFPFIYPRSIINSCQDWIDKQRTNKGIYFSQRGAWYKVIFQESFSHHPAPKTLAQPNKNAFYNNQNYLTGKGVLFYLPDSYLFTHKGFVLNSKNQLFQEFSHNFGANTLKGFLLRRPFFTFSKNIKYIDKIGAVLISPESQNYYHWLNDVLPRIKLYEQVLDQIDHFCVAANVPEKFLDILPTFGIKKDKILLVEKNEKLHFNYLYVSSLPGSEGRSPEWVINYIREKLIKPLTPLQPFKKLYFTRESNTERKILNEGDIINVLEKQGFEIVNPGTLNINEQILLIQQAKIVIGAHGAAFSNLLFSNDNITVIELFTPDYLRTDCYYTLSANLGINYWYIIGIKPPNANWGDIIINEDLLLDTIKQGNA